MKNKKLLTALYIILMLLPLIAVVVAYPFLPDKIPAHYGMNNQVTRWGNKSETFIFLLLQYSLDFLCILQPEVPPNKKRKEAVAKK